MTPRPGLFPTKAGFTAALYPASTLRLNVLAGGTPVFLAVTAVTACRAHAALVGAVTSPISDAMPMAPNLFAQGFAIEHQLLMALGGVA